MAAVMAISNANVVFQDRDIRKYAVNAPSALMMKILKHDPNSIKDNLRVSVQVFRKIISLMPYKRSGWSRELELSVFFCTG